MRRERGQSLSLAPWRRRRRYPPIFVDVRCVVSTPANSSIVHEVVGKGPELSGQKSPNAVLTR